ncbi:MAG: hypothetical protein KF684_01985 [Phycisphaeraceae bacterium]|nr:hypothetical protein [Phycisphaeraceae bacterium]
MTTPIDELIRRCQTHRDAGAKEKKLREEFVSHLRRVFPDTFDQAWIDHYIEGAETTQRGKKKGGARAAIRFVDTLVRATVMEYEPDIRDRATYDHGKAQVQEYAANLIAAGTPVEQARGVLTDFVKWEVYGVSLRRSVAPKDTLPEHIELTVIEEFDTTRSSPHLGDQFKAFLKAHLAREQSRIISAENLVLDIGLKSRLFGEYASSLQALVVAARKSDDCVNLATALWARFIDHLETGGTSFRANHYAAELFFTIVVRLLSANILTGTALRSDADETGSILTGGFFAERFRLSNFVERDYFGWIADNAHLPSFIPLAQRIQLDLTAYDFTRLPDTEVFGPLIGQLGEETQRHLLGQANTPHWLAERLADRAINQLPRGVLPNFVDMCCGSGAIIAECLKAVLRRNRTLPIERLAECVTGFDVDPLAVSFAKTTWVLTLRVQITAAIHAVTIPIYHADSLFVASPTARGLPASGGSHIDVDLDGTIVRLPSVLIQPEFRQVFDDIVDWAYDTALDAGAKGGAAGLSEALAGTRLDAALAAHAVSLEPAIADAARVGLFHLAQRMTALAIARRNGLWAFILKNTYRPSLLAGQFNGIISNPPWLALSKIANNPYKERITDRTDSYGLRPTGSSFLHLEIATTFLTYAVDRYLAPQGQIAILLPGTLVNGDHHQPFRNAAYQTAARSVLFQIDELWNVKRETFKAPCVAVIGHKTGAAGVVDSDHVTGFISEPAHHTPVDFSVHTLGSRRTAWSISEAGTDSKAGAAGHLTPNQGADLMPRTAVCVTIVDRTGTEWKVETPTTTGAMAHVVADSKKMKSARFNGFVAPPFIHGMLQSKSLVPFAFDPRLPSIAIPVTRAKDRSLTFVSDEEIRAMGHRQTAIRFAKIGKAYEDDGIDKAFRTYLDERGKLLKQTFPATGYLVLTGPGGSNTAGAVYELTPSRSAVLVDQTLYWYWLDSQEAADYYVGLFNSGPLAERINVFIPEGVFGRRHLHTVPWQVAPVFDPANASHRQVAALSGSLREQVAKFIRNCPELEDPGKWLKTGRRLIRDWLESNPDMQALNKDAAKVLKTTAP